MGPISAPRELKNDWRLQHSTLASAGLGRGDWWSRPVGREGSSNLSFRYGGGVRLLTRVGQQLSKVLMSAKEKKRPCDLSEKCLWYQKKRKKCEARGGGKGSGSRLAVGLHL